MISLSLYGETEKPKLIVDTFLISDPHEIDVLLVKLHNEAIVVDRFIAVESSHTFRGEEKPRFLRDLLKKDDRFSLFRDKVDVLEIPNQYTGSGYFGPEFSSRNAVKGMLTHLHEDSWVMVSDVDESVDFSCPKRRKFILRELKAREGAHIANISVRRYWYDYDNLCKLDWLRIPFVPYKRIPNNSLNSFRKDGPVIRHPEMELAFEYSHCFSREGNLRKLTTFAHDGYNLPAELDEALRLNTWIKCKNRGESLDWDNPEDFFEQVELNEGNSPRYVRDNLEQLKTNIVNRNYREARRLTE